MIITAKNYSYAIEDGIIDKIGELLINEHSACKILIVSDTNVAPIYLSAVKKSLESSGFDVSEHILPAGEKNKNLEGVVNIINTAAEIKLTRSDLMLALGGGVVGDMTGFAASIYMRGIKYVNIPTTLLSMVDSSIGGKTGVDLPSGKNLVGSFCMPLAVLCDPNVLKTLPDEEISCGMAEVIKTAVIGNADLFSFLCECPPKALLPKSVIEKAAEYKIRITDRDTYENNERMILNFGHTFGHGIELLSDYSISHGKAVASGMHLMTNASEKKGYCPKGVTQKLDDVLLKFNLDPYIFNGFSVDDLKESVIRDKKKRGDKYSLIFIENIGKATIVECDEDSLDKIINLGVQND